MKRIYDILTSMRSAVTMMLLYALLLAVATGVEKYMGTDIARRCIYHAPLMMMLMIGMTMNGIGVALRYRLWKKPAFLLVHAAFVVILVGATLTFFFGQEGSIHIREGQTVRAMSMRHDKEETLVKLPFSIELQDFTLTRYPGSSFHASYESVVRVHDQWGTSIHRIYMNNILDLHGYRLFQASYDQDERGTILFVNHDAVGRRVTYTGYILLGIGLILSLLMPGSRFSRVRKQLKALHRTLPSLTGLAFGIFLFIPVQMQAGGCSAEEVVQQLAVPQAHACRVALLPMQSATGRMMPVHTFASQVVRKLHQDEDILGLTPTQFLLSVIVMPQQWRNIPIIPLPGKGVADILHADDEYCSYAHLFDTDGTYLLQHHIEDVLRKQPSHRTSTDKDLLKLHQQANLLHQIMHGQLLRLFPVHGDSLHRWVAAGDDLSVLGYGDSCFVAHIMQDYTAQVRACLQGDSWHRADSIVEEIDRFQTEHATEGLGLNKRKLQTEVMYNELDLFHLCMVCFLVLGGTLLLISIVEMIRSSEVPSPTLHLMQRVCMMAVFAAFLIHAYGMGLRWYVAGYAPWSNSYESMVYVAWVTVLAGICFARSNKMALALASVFGGIILFVSRLNWMDPEITPLVPVLQSRWLMFHVAVIVGAYGFFGLGCLLGLTNILLMNMHPAEEKRKRMLEWRIEQLTLTNELALWTGLALMTAGTFLGAVWANESWGRYWGWDPKETWALITMVIYAVVTHMHLLGMKNRLWWFNCASVLAFACVLMTFFGVNLWLSGMHSYG